MEFYDKIKIKIIAGKGGNGSPCMLREKYNKFGGPSGGDGGQGGNIFFVIDNKINTLISYFYKKIYISKNGKNGKCFSKSGKSAKDLILRLPYGTIIRDLDKNFFIIDLIENNKKFLLAKGGSGGLGNLQFKNSFNQSPKKFTYGLMGESRNLELELKVFSHVSLLGMPNVGKSTFINNISNTNVKVSSHRFTTLIPHQGIIDLNFKKLITIIDIPGIIENAYYGFGLGLKFLRHIERTKLILHLIDLSLIIDNYIDFINNIKVINNELYNYNINNFYKSRWLVLSKLDLIKLNFMKFFIKKNLKIINWYKKIFFISSISSKGCYFLCKQIYYNIYDKIYN